MATQKILKVGNSLGITLPSNLVKDLSLKPGDQVDVVREITNTLTINFVDSHQLSLGLSPQNRHKKQL
jgi:antitoxin component of MazEF toxin-antitoxin module